MNPEDDSEQTKQAKALSDSAILERRSVALARAIATGIEQKDQTSLVEFELGGEHYAFESETILRIMEVKNMTVLPSVPSFIAGVINMHGEIVMVIHLADYFNLRKQPIGNTTRIIVVEHSNIKIGVLVDAIVDMKRLDLSGLQTDLLMMSENVAKIIKGVYQGKLIVLDIPKLILSKDIIINQVG